MTEIVPICTVPEAGALLQFRMELVSLFTQRPWGRLMVEEPLGASVAGQSARGWREQGLGTRDLGSVFRRKPVDSGGRGVYYPKLSPSGYCSEGFPVSLSRPSCGLKMSEQR